MRDTDRLLERTAIDRCRGRQLAIVRARKDGLVKRLRSMRLRMAMAAGERLPFDRESAVLFDATVPTVAPESYRDAIDRIASLVPGSGVLAERIEAFRSRMTIPPERLADVFDAAIAECRRRTLEHIALPDSESFTLEYVTDQPWSGYNWYQGDQHSLIQINTDLPIFIDRAVDLGCHEGYPGHHTYNVLTETKLVRERGWVEFTLGPLFGPSVADFRRQRQLRHRACVLGRRTARVRAQRARAARRARSGGCRRLSRSSCRARWSRRRRDRDCAALPRWHAGRVT